MAVKRELVATAGTSSMMMTVGNEERRVERAVELPPDFQGISHLSVVTKTTPHLTRKNRGDIAETAGIMLMKRNVGVWEEAGEGCFFEDIGNS
ncbi:hypothetical protein N7456_010773 [Penicillium angulare]|uniref:Uncharacterized protein n=1 Tax=Penicillium angulare TaxID=116970 RepID=A0A9W9ESG3_9EURO|nr:hypothetical protein N7456_010773 [Penicillium angulare]